MKLSVIIVSYNVKYFLEQCLHSVMKACVDIDSEIFVVDNNSVDGSIEMVKQKFPAVQIISNKDNKGFSKANNQAIKASKGEYILLLNPDTVVEEDTFEKIIRFMDAHPDAGALGVKMIDGSGKFLPESKRGLPTPMVAFYKIFGLAKLFPKSNVFGRYHLTYLDKERINKVDVLAGAFMLIRKSVLEKTGLLDEDYFMYGEDIDLSYRITKAGYKNYYFPETRIIHYKGESTKKSSVNYVLVFYNAMIIFARKHFTHKNASVFSFLIKLAIYIRAAAAILSRFFEKAFFPVTDFILLLAGMYLLKEYWGKSVLVNYPQEYMLYAVPAYIIIWITSIFFSGGYDQPVRLSKIVRGVISGTILILVIYALLPEEYRFSRALILLGTVLAVVALPAMRLFIGLFGWKKFTLESNERKRLLIVGSPDESNRVLSLLKLSDNNTNFIGFVYPEIVNGKANGFGEYQKYYLGEISNLNAILDVYNIDEVIFCAKDIASNQIIRFMSGRTSKEVEFKIAPPESLYIIGSSSVNNPGELYVIDINSISKIVNKRNKRVIDVIISLFLLTISPLAIIFQRNPTGLYSNIFNVLFGKRSWVGYRTPSNETLPKIRKGVLNPLDGINNKALDDNTLQKLNLLYAKDYKVNNDLNIIRKAWRELGRKVIA